MVTKYTEKRDCSLENGNAHGEKTDMCAQDSGQDVDL